MTTAPDVVAEWRKLSLFDGRQGLQRMYRDVYALRKLHRYEEIGEILSILPIDDFAAEFLVGLLTVTAASARDLPLREGLFKAVQARLRASTSKSKADAVLAGLACEEGWTAAVPED
jgi:hypothetical protein